MEWRSAAAKKTALLVHAWTDLASGISFVLA